MTPAELQQPITIVNQMPEQGWWQAPLLLLLGAFIALGTSWANSALARRHEHKSERDILLGAFLAILQ